MQKEDIIARVKGGEFSKEKLLVWLEAMPRGTMKPTRFKIGDVFMHPIFRHPYILLKKIDDESYICGLLTSEESCTNILEPARSRYPYGYFTKTLFVETPTKKHSYMSIYDNPKHLKKVFEKLKSIML